MDMAFYILLIIHTSQASVATAYVRLHVDLPRVSLARRCESRPIAD
jgi:hypothetical protein